MNDEGSSGRTSSSVTLAVTTFVILGVGVAIYFGLIAGFDATALIIFSLIVLVGLLAIVVARKSNAGRVGPAYCRECGGVVSPNAPYCKHCGANFGSSLRTLGPKDPDV